MKRSITQMMNFAVECEMAWQRRARSLPDGERRKLFGAFFQRRQRAIDEQCVYIPDRPAHLRHLTCGARTQSGAACRMTALFANGRCIWHGGKSTGPRSPEGKARAIANLELGRRKRRELTVLIK